MPAFSQAASYTWIGPTGDWSDASNWGGTEPTINDSADINNGGTVTITQTGEACTSLRLGDATIDSGTVQMTGGSLKVFYGECIGYSGTGAFTQTGGTNTITNKYDLELGLNSGSSGIYNLSDTGQLSAGYEFIGRNGAGTFTQTGGTNIITNYFYLGLNSGSSGTYNLSGTGQLTASSECIGLYGMGTFTQTGGINTAIDINIGNNGTYTLTAGTLNVSGVIENHGIWDLSNSSAVINASSMIVDLTNALINNAQKASLKLDAHSLLIVPSGFDPSGYFATYENLGILHQVGSTLVISPTYSINGAGSINDHVNCQGTISAKSGYSIHLYVGLSISGTGNVDLGGAGALYVDDINSGMSGGTLKADYHIIGSTSTGTFVQTGGINTISEALSLGVNSGKNGSYILSGTGQLDVNSEYVGFRSTGTFIQNGGINTTLCLKIGYYSGSNGSYNLSDKGQLSAWSEEYIGYSGTGMFTQTGGTNSTDDFYLGYKSTSHGTYNLNNGQLTANNEYIGGYDGFGTGTFTQSGGINTVSHLYLGNNHGSTGTYNFTGGTLITSSILKGSGTAVFNFGGGTLKTGYEFYCSLPLTLTGTGGNANIDTTGNSVTMTGILSGEGGLNKLGSGKLTLSASNSYLGNTYIKAGILTLSSSGSFGSSPIVDIMSGATLDVRRKAQAVD